MRRTLSSCLIAGALGLLSSTPAVAVSVARSAPQVPAVQVTAVSVAASIEPTQVLGTDGLTHLAYELLMVNYGTDPATVASVQALDAADQSRVLDSLSGADVAARFKIASIGGAPSSAAVIGPGQEGIVFMDATVVGGLGVPRDIVNKVRITYPEPQAGGLVPADVTVTVARTPVSDVPAPVIQPPLSGTRWFDANGCCSVLTAHRGAVNPLNGGQNFPERAAIDWIKLDDQNRLFTGDPTKLSSYAYYGAPVMAAVDGEVVVAVDGLPNQVPTIEPPLGTLPLTDFAGNHVIEKFTYAGRVYYALYAHMVPGSVLAHVHVGEHLRAGQTIGQVGNSGNTTAPHLHFQVMDQPNELASQGLPFMLDRQYLRGRAASENVLDDLFAGKPFTYAPGVQPSWLFYRMPIYLDVADFYPEKGR